MLTSKLSSINNTFLNTDPKREHGDAIRWLARYLKGTRDKGTIFRPDPKRELEVYVDADFAGNWDPKEANDRDTARSRHGYFIMYKGCPILWKSQLQGEIALSSTESKYIGLSHALREVIPLMQLLNEMKQYGFPVKMTKPKIHCKVFEDNSGALEMAKVHKKTLQCILGLVILTGNPYCFISFSSCISGITSRSVCESPMYSLLVLDNAISP